MTYLTRLSRGRAPQSAPIPGSTQVRNSAGGFAWAIDEWALLRRFLILGSEGGTFYAGEWNLTRENAQALEACLDADGPRTVAEIVAVSEDGRAPKNDPAIFALAMAAGHRDEATRKAALEALPRVARISTHLFQFATFVEGFRGWGRSLRRAVGGWYAARTPESLAYQAVKYRQRDGMTHRDLLRLAHPAGRVGAGNPTLELTDGHQRLFEWIARGSSTRDGSTEGLPRIVEGFAAVQAAETPGRAAELVREYGLPREALPSECLASPEVWEALLDDMPMTALVRNLATMTRVGALAPGSAGTAKAIGQLGDRDRIRKARVHPIALLAALRTYAAGRGVRGRGTWTPVPQIVDALDAAFYTAFENVEPTGKRFLLALDVSGSMAGGMVAGVPGLTPRDASAALALVTAATETRYEAVGFFSGRGGLTGRTQRYAGRQDGLTPLAISPRQRLDDAIRKVSDLPFGGTDCALPMLYALAYDREVDVFVILTDSETWAGDIHPVHALDEYRRASGIEARLVVVGMVSNGFTIAAPQDPGMLDVVGFDTATPQLISDFARAAL
ncbi:MAG TPA: TROVE domain-containing protein [Gaiellaceae bacterium]|jgi:60 kDa SS-A/Ro ribonucleoprotein|nr:TROVE domain-containing protein [Gaiellaceae bacterium]